MFHVVRCASCALVYLNPRPDSKELPGYYPPEYQNGLRDYPHNQKAAIVKVGQDMWLRRRTPPFVPGGRVLDIGCSGGGYLLALREKGWDVHGVEMDPAVAEFTRSKFDIDVRTGAAEGVLRDFPDGHFDVVTMWHVLEHLSDPSKVLSEIRRILKPGGRLMLEVPNFRCLSRMLLRTYWFPLELPRHFYHFTPRTLEAMLTKAGFQHADVKGVPSALAITLSLQLLWNKWTGNLEGRGFILNPLLLVLFFFPSWLLARVGWSAHMTADAGKPAFQS
jgi:2-polyprenyl-3-methyl-5-hydroxy-6-metoxy-1,4-benzoquinol methylase